MRIGLWIALGALLFAGIASSARGVASGPDFFRVVGLAEDEELDVRAAPDAEAERLGAIPPGTDGVRNLGCEGGLTYAEWAQATPAEREAAARRRWCRVAWGGVEGWVGARFLGEGSAPATAAAGSAAVPTAPEEGGPRLWEVKGGPLDLRETASGAAPSVARYEPGTLLHNLGCRRAEAGVWCDVQELGGGPRGFVPADGLAPAVSPDGAVATGPDDSALRAGRGDFDATGRIPCASQAGQPMGACDFAVARACGGWATVVVTRPDGRPRVITFANGRAIGAGTSEADPGGPFRATREADLHTIRLGDERYEIPDAVVLGG
jgi:hypothetical protein